MTFKKEFLDRKCCSIRQVSTRNCLVLYVNNYTPECAGNTVSVCLSYCICTAGKDIG